MNINSVTPAKQMISISKIFFLSVSDIAAKHKPSDKKRTKCPALGI